MQTHSTPPADTATANHNLSPSAVSQLSMSHLHSVYETVCGTIDMLQGIICQPRFGDDAAATLNPAGEMLDDFIDHLFNCRRLMLDTAEAASPSEPSQAEMRAWMLLHRAVHDRDHLPDACSLAAQMVARQSHVEFHAKRRIAA